jgi:hypothetical protein
LIFLVTSSSSRNPFAFIFLSSFLFIAVAQG